LLLLKVMSDTKSQDPPDLPETVAFSGKIGEVIHTAQKDGRIFECYRRPPGTRLIIISPERKILVTKEHRSETAGIDLRLPGGKVCDNLQDYHALLDSGKDIVEATKTAATKEALEETGLIIEDPRLIAKAHAGATVEWDLYYFRVDKYTESPNGQELEEGEDIEVAWMTANELRQAIANDQMQEWRSVGVLLAKVLPELENG
jgi:8-oxo-dGTP pyrophosphatase MutT (NUDIX family)